MKRSFLALAVFVFSQCPLFAEDRVKGEVFDGYSFISNTGLGSRVASHGWNATYQHYIDDRIGVVGDFGGYYRQGVRTLIYSAGPQLNVRQDKFDWFGRALFGNVRTTGGSGFVMTYGGGVDLKMGDKVKVRAVQIDWMPVHIFNDWDYSPVRFSFGASFKAF
jgi:hypothetical protein